MHCISLAILSWLSRFPSPAVGTNWPFWVDVPLKHQSINSLYWLFKYTLARREDFTTITGCTSFPLKVCSHRWVENIPVCEWALSLLLHIKSYVSAVATGTSPAFRTKSFEVIKGACCDSLMKAKLLFCISVANQITPFLTSFQTDKPMAPFICYELYKILKSLMKVHNAVGAYWCQNSCQAGQDKLYKGRNLQGLLKNGCWLYNWEWVEEVVKRQESEW